jgi:hypothetical protein
MDNNVNRIKITCSLKIKVEIFIYRMYEVIIKLTIVITYFKLY